MNASARRSDPEQRRAQLIAAAMTTFADKGVAATTVSDIVRSAGVAQGTFYLYFESKDCLVNAVVEEMVHEVVAKIEKLVEMPGASALERFSAMRTAFIESADEPHEQELQTLFHKPENRAVHDRLALSIGPRIAPVVAEIIEQGIEEGVFVEQDPHAGAWAVLGVLQGLETGLGDPGKVVAGIEEMTAFVLRGLGYSGPLAGPKDGS